MALHGRYRTLYDKQYRLEADRFINPGEDFTPEPPKVKVPPAPGANEALCKSAIHRISWARVRDRFRDFSADSAIRNSKSAAIHLHHEGAREGAPSRPRCPQRHLAVVSAGRQDRRPRAERIGQEHAAPDHGRAGRAVHRRGVAGRGHQRRLSRAGAAARSRRRRCSGNVEEGVAELKALLTRYDEINAKFGEDLSPEEMDKVLEEQGKVQDRIEAADGWDLDSRLELAMDALRLPPADADVTTLSGGERRRVALCRLLLKSPGPAAARRADQPPRRRVGRVARAVPQGLPGHGRRRHARSLLSRQRRRLDPRARSRARASRGKATTRRGSSRSRSASRSRRSRKPSGSGRSRASSTGSACLRAPARRRARRA